MSRWYVAWNTRAFAVEYKSNYFYCWIVFYCLSQETRANYFSFYEKVTFAVRSGYCDDILCLTGSVSGRACKPFCSPVAVPARWRNLDRSGLPTVSREKMMFSIPYNGSFIDLSCSVKMAVYWPSWKTQKITWSVHSHIDPQLGEY